MMLEALVAPAIILAWLFIGPPIIRGGKRNNNNGFRVLLQYAVDIEAKGQSPRGVRAQEVGEFRLAWILSLPVAFFAGLAASDYGLAVSALAGVFLAALAQSIGRKLTDSYDLIGHGAEILVAEAEGREGYREAEARRMLWSRKDQTLDEVLANLKKWEWASRLMVRIT